MQRMEENNEARAIVDMTVPGKRSRGRLMDWRITYNGSSLAIAIFRSVFADVLGSKSKSNKYKLNEWFS